MKGLPTDALVDHDEQANHPFERDLESPPSPLADCVVGLIYTHRLALLDLQQAKAERDSYRWLSQQAIHQIRLLTLDLDQLRARHHRVLDEYRQFRERTIGCERPVA